MYSGSGAAGAPEPWSELQSLRKFIELLGHRQYVSISAEYFACLSDNRAQLLSYLFESHDLPYSRGVRRTELIESSAKVLSPVQHRRADLVTESATALIVTS